MPDLKLSDYQRSMIVVGTGASIGALIRYVLNLIIPGLWGILVINIIACAIMGYKKPGLFLGTGLLGGMSTFSTYIAYAHGSAFYAVISIISCVAAYLLFDDLSHRLASGSASRTPASQATEDEVR
ncbi:MAG: CrcB family protein [Corynebacterium sp.]|nr:CrcB family protein [Corynebacterium sp.]